MRLRQRFFNVMHTGFPLALKKLKIRGNGKSQGKVAEFKNFARKSGNFWSVRENYIRK